MSANQDTSTPSNRNSTQDTPQTPTPPNSPPYLPQNPTLPNVPSYLLQNSIPPNATPITNNSTPRSDKGEMTKNAYDLSNDMWEENEATNTVPANPSVKRKQENLGKIIIWTVFFILKKIPLICLSRKVVIFFPTLSGPIDVLQGIMGSLIYDTSTNLNKIKITIMCEGLVTLDRCFIKSFLYSKINSLITQRIENI
jgi:hypothetical protein